MRYRSYILRTDGSENNYDCSVRILTIKLRDSIYRNKYKIHKKVQLNRE
jgi:hypothetical protein